MKKILIAVFCFLSLFSKAQVYQSMPQYGYAAHRMSFDSTLQIPTFCGVPTLKSNVLKFGAIAFDSCNNRFYFYNPKTAIWDTIKGGGSSIDTTSLSNRINLKLNIADTTAMLSKYLRIIDTSNKWINNIIRTPGKDSIIFYKDGNRYAIKDSVGSNPPALGYYGAWQDTLTQTADLADTGYPLILRIPDLENGITVVTNGSGNKSRITFANTGIYNIQFSVQVQNVNTSNSNEDVSIWLRKNGIDVPGSAGRIYVPKKVGSRNGHIVAGWNFLLSVIGGEYYEFVWNTSNAADVTLQYYAAQNPPPSTASVVLTVTQQSGILAGTGMTALNGLSGAVQTFAVDSTNSTFKITSSGTAHTFNIPNASASGVTRGLISNTQYTTFNNKIGSGDTASMLTNYLRKIDTATLQNKSLAAYSFQANKTNATANATANTFKDTSGVYSGTPTYSGTAPSGTTNHTFRFTQIGKMCTIQINLSFSAGGSPVSISMPLPSFCPTPVAPTGMGADGEILYTGVGMTWTTRAIPIGTGLNSARACWMRISSSVYQIVVFNFSASSSPFVSATLTYYTN